MISIFSTPTTNYVNRCFTLTLLSRKLASSVYVAEAAVNRSTHLDPAVGISTMMDHSMVLLNAQVQFLVRKSLDVPRKCSLFYTGLLAFGSSVWFGRFRGLYTLVLNSRTTEWSFVLLLIVGHPSMPVLTSVPLYRKPN